MPASISICFTKNDQDLIAWANMLRRENMSPATWVQAILLCEVLGKEIDAGGVFIPKQQKTPQQTNKILFGDDTMPSPNISSQSPPQYSWGARGENGEYKEGSILAIRLTRPVMLGAVEKILLRRRQLGPYTKAVIRKHLRKLQASPNEPPDPTQIQDLFILYEDAFIKEDLPPKNRKTHSKTKETIKNNKSADRETQVPPATTQESTHQKETTSKKKNPLLGYII